MGFLFPVIFFSKGCIPVTLSLMIIIVEQVLNRQTYSKPPVFVSKLYSFGIKYPVDPL
jgi:hypothetical protein